MRLNLTMNMNTSVHPDMVFKKGNISKKQLIDLYLGMLKPRLIEEKMLILLRQGRISKWFSGIGQEAIAVGATMALQLNEVIFPMHRNLGVFTSRNIPLKDLFCQWQGKMAGFTKGRDRSFHFGTMDYNIVGMISHLGPQLSLASGVALSHVLRTQQQVSLAFTGEGGTSEGEFHEALNVAAVWNLPVIFVIENNGYGLSTPSSQQFVCQQLADRGKGYGMDAYTIDGNNVLEVYKTIDKIAKEIRKNPKPVLIECMTFRMRGHEEASGTKYVPKDLMDAWALKDPIDNYEQFLLDEGYISPDQIDAWKASIKKEINEHLELSYQEPERAGDITLEREDVFAPHNHIPSRPQNETKEMRMIDAISDGLNLAMEQHEDLVLMGQDIAEYGGVFKITNGFLEKYGEGRVRNTPLCESAILGIGIGLSIQGIKSMVEMQFSDFVTCGFNQIVNNAAKLHYRWGQAVNMVIRMPSGGGVGAGPFHSQTTEAWFYKVPGLKLVYPSTPADAKGLLLAAFEDPNPVLFFEHKGLYRNVAEEVPTGYYTIELGKANLVREGTNFSIITYGMGVKWAEEIVDSMDVSADIIDLRTLNPLDYSAIETSVKKTNRVILLHEDSLTGGIGGDLAAYIAENLFEYLDAPVLRCASEDTPIPFAHALEDDYMAKSKLADCIERIIKY